MRSTARGFGPSFRRFWKSFTRGAVRVLSLLFKVWIAGMLIGYFALFVALFLLALSFSHFSQEEAHTGWLLEVIVHHAGLPLALTFADCGLRIELEGRPGEGRR